MLKFSLCLLTVISLTFAWQTTYAQNRAGMGVGSSNTQLNRQLDMVTNVQNSLEKITDCAQQGHIYNPDTDACQSVPAPTYDFSDDGTELAIQNPDGSMGTYVDIEGDMGDAGDIITESN